jgi:CheY-like chemotaxis protein
LAKLLVIEDNDAVRAVACRVLRSIGHQVLEADSGQIGVELVRRELPDLMITDIFMPEQEGIETIRQVREIAPRLPILAISSLSQWGESRPLENARMVGADLALEKPFSLEALIAAVQQLLDRDAPARGDGSL